MSSHARTYNPENANAFKKENPMKRNIALKKLFTVACAAAVLAGTLPQAATTAQAQDNPVNGGVILSQSVPENLQSDNLYALMDGETTPSPHYSGNRNMGIWSGYNAAQQGIRNITLTFDFSHIREAGSGSEMDDAALLSYDGM